MKRERERSLWHSLFTGGYVSTYVGAVIKNPNHFFFVFASGVEVMCSRTEGPAWLNSPPSSSSCVMSIYIRRYTRMLPSSGLPIRFQGGSQDTYVLEKERWWSPHLLLFLPLSLMHSTSIVVGTKQCRTIAKAEQQQKSEKDLFFLFRRCWVISIWRRAQRPGEKKHLWDPFRTEIAIGKRYRQ